MRLMIVAAAACLALLAAQFWLIGRVELTFDEAYYTLWSRSDIAEILMPSTNVPSRVTRQLLSLPYWLPFNFHQSGV